MADEGDRVVIGISHPFSSPPAINKDTLDAFMLKTRGERRLLKIAIECPAIWQLVHFLAAGAPMRESTFDAS